MLDYGTRFELYVAKLYSDLNKKNVTHNQSFSVVKCKKKIRSQIDIIYSNWFINQYVECKYKESKRKGVSKVNLNDVSKFVAVLELLDVPGRRGEIITNSYFVDRARVYCENHKIKMYDFNDLVKMERKRGSFLNRVLKSDKGYSKIIHNNIKKAHLYQNSF